MTPASAESAHAAALACAGAAALLAMRTRPGERRARLVLAGASGPRFGPGQFGRGQRWNEVMRRADLRALAARTGRHWAAIPVGLLIAWATQSVLPLACAAAAVPLLRRHLRRREQRRAAERTEGAVLDFCLGLVAELRSGRQADAALLAVGTAGLGQAGSAVLAAARFGGDVPAALHRAARTPGAGGLLGVAACWRAAVDGGAGLADGLDRVASALRAEREQREEVRAQLAGPRSTAVVLALLPLFGLVLGATMGADPVRVLLHSPVGWAVLTAAGLLEWAGLAWVSRIVRTAEGGGAS
ncbi:type II secretion system F family protein [Streptomyces sp. 549]|uniref:type II secretion system F family protein n=1 Tax=Streptomyces sp. 549 TaxID=3049076 RepID=UPI0024C39B2A|nr:type II secretion system F family protein [Streptomyces sp. 549]MDK1476339.1 type II secretion system F family protein [Streptomyces sp. 549]